MAVEKHHQPQFSQTMMRQCCLGKTNPKQVFRLAFNIILLTSLLTTKSINLVVAHDGFFHNRLHRSFSNLY